MGARGRWPRPVANKRPVDEVVRELREHKPQPGSYRDRSLKINGLICARCGREFEEKDRRLLTVHHKDGNPKNNPRDGSNWENLCVYCHDAEHSRQTLGDELHTDPDEQG